MHPILRRKLRHCELDLLNERLDAREVLRMLNSYFSEVLSGPTSAGSDLQVRMGSNLSDALYIKLALRDMTVEEVNDLTTAEANKHTPLLQEDEAVQALRNKQWDGADGFVAMTRTSVRPQPPFKAPTLTSRARKRERQYTHEQALQLATTARPKKRDRAGETKRRLKRQRNQREQKPQDQEDPHCSKCVSAGLRRTWRIKHKATDCTKAKRDKLLRNQQKYDDKKAGKEKSKRSRTDKPGENERATGKSDCARGYTPLTKRGPSTE